MSYEARVVLLDSVERGAFNQLMDAIDEYRAKKRAGPQTPPPQETAPAAPEKKDTAVVGEIGEGGVKVVDRRAARPVVPETSTIVPETSTTEITYEMIFQALTNYVKNHPDGLKAGRKLLDEFETVHVNKLPKEKYVEFYKRLLEPVVVA